jgi:hypothetical protein
MTREEINYLVLNTFNQVLVDNEKIMNENLSEETVLMGPDSPFDSVDLVTFIVSLEQTLEDDYNLSLTLADDRAMSQESSPFKSIKSISDYIEFLIK